MGYSREDPWHVYSNQAPEPYVREGLIPLCTYNNGNAAFVDCANASFEIRYIDLFDPDFLAGEGTGKSFHQWIEEWARSALS